MLALCVWLIVPGTRQTACLFSVQLLIGLGEECREGRACASEDPIPMHTKMAEIGLSGRFFFFF